MRLLDPIFVPYGKRPKKKSDFESESGSLPRPDFSCVGATHDTELILDNIEFLGIGDVLHNRSTGENMLVTGVSEERNAVSVCRGYSGTRQKTVQVHDIFTMIGMET